MKKGFRVPYKSSISDKCPRVPAWHPSDSDSTWSHDIKSIKTHCGTFTARLDKKSCFGCQTTGRILLYSCDVGNLTGWILLHFQDDDLRRTDFCNLPWPGEVSPDLPWPGAVSHDLPWPGEVSRDLPWRGRCHMTYRGRGRCHMTYRGGGAVSHDLPWPGEVSHDLPWPGAVSHNLPWPGGGVT